MGRAFPCIHEGGYEGVAGLKTAFYLADLARKDQWLWLVDVTDRTA